MIQLQCVSKSFDEGAIRAVQNLSLDVQQGELLAIIGESGSGKTTTLKMMNRLLEPSEGNVVLEGQDAATVDPIALRRRIGYVFQGIGLFPHYTVAENVAIVPRLLRWKRARIDERVNETLELVGLPPATFRNRLPRDLSGGQRQRVGVARALASEPRIMLLDEPFGALDPITRASMQDEFQRIRSALQLTAVLVTHDMTEALLIADRIAVMKDGRLMQVGTPRDIMRSPEHQYVRELVEMPKRRADKLENLLDDAG